MSGASDLPRKGSADFAALAALDPLHIRKGVASILVVHACRALGDAPGNSFVDLPHVAGAGGGCSFWCGKVWNGSLCSWAIDQVLDDVRLVLALVDAVPAVGCVAVVARNIVCATTRHSFELARVSVCLVQALRR